MAATNSKIIIGDEVILDLTADTAEDSTVLKGVTYHKKDGSPSTGACTFDVDSSGATASVAEILSGATAAVRGAIVEGTMPRRGAQTGSISTKNGTVSILQGYHDGSGSIGISDAEKAKIVASNIKSGVQILGVTGDYGGEIATAETKEVTPSMNQQVITPTSADYLSQVTVKAIPVNRVLNASGGYTVTIG